MEASNNTFHAPMAKDANVVVVSLYCKNRGPKLVEILQKHGYQNVRIIGMWQLMNSGIKYETIDQADYIVTVDPRTEPDLMDYGFSPGQRLISLDVDIFDGVIGDDNCRIREPGEIYDDLRRQIEPYLSYQND